MLLYLKYDAQSSACEGSSNQLKSVFKAFIPHNGKMATETFDGFFDVDLMNLQFVPLKVIFKTFRDKVAPIHHILNHTGCSYTIQQIF